MCSIGVKESAAAHEAFTKFGEYHRQMEKVGIQMLKKTKRVRHKIELFLFSINFKRSGDRAKRDRSDFIYLFIFFFSQFC